MELKKYKLGDVLSEFHSGKSIKAESIKSFGKYPVFGANGLRGYTDTYNHDGETVIIGRQGAYCGNVKYYSGEAYYTEHAIIAKTKSFVNAKYLSALLPFYKLEKYQGQSAQPGLSVETISKIDIHLPDIELQNRYAKLLSSIDRKIALNRAINRNLEAMTKQLYDYWFVQFDFPNAEGKPYKSSGGKMVWNETLKREIPEGWEVLNFESLFEIGNGKTIPDSEGLFPAYGGNGVVKYVGESNYDACFVIGRVGANCGSVLYSPIPCWVSDNAIAITPRNIKNSPYLLNTLKLYDLSQGKGGSSQPLITHAGLKRLLFPFLKSVVDKYCEIANLQLNMLYNNLTEIQTLTGQRDTLLPLLMNGQVTIK